MSNEDGKSNLKEGTNSFYCTDSELLEEANRMIDSTDEYRSVSHFISVCLRHKVESEMSHISDGKIDIEIEDEELANYVENKHEKGEFFSETHVVIVALERMKEDDKGQMLV